MMNQAESAVLILMTVTMLTVTHGNPLSVLLQRLGNETLQNDMAIHTVDKEVKEILGQNYELANTVNTVQQLNQSLNALMQTAKVDDCASNPCVHGICRDFFAGYSCHCSPGYTGNRCQNIDDCPLNACGLQGKCIDLQDDYRCNCWNGKHGRNCDKIYQDCYDIKENETGTESGVYTIHVDIGGSLHPKQVYCDMETEGGGWTVFLNRFNGEEDFARTWIQYEEGFGDQAAEHWLGLKWLNLMTSSKNYSLRVDLSKPDGSTAYQEYNTFSIGEGPGYVLHLGTTTSGTAGDGGEGLSYHNNRAFTAKDNTTSSCSTSQYPNNGGWWFKSCFHVYLTAIYGTDNYFWYSWTKVSPLTSSSMKIRPV